MTIVTVTDLSPVVTVTDSPTNFHIEIGVSPPVFNLTGHSIVVGSGGVNGFLVVYLAFDGTARPADGFNPTHAGKVVGLASAAQPEGEPAIIQLAGEIKNPAWHLTPGRVYFLVAGGEISMTPPESGFVQKIGVAKTSTELVISLGESTVR